jgi:hypothetical protein
MSTLCASGLVQDYQISRWQGPKRTTLLATGQSLAGIGAAGMVDGGLVYVRVEAPPPGPRGPLADAPRSPSSIWLWDVAGGARGKLLDAERGIGAIHSPARAGGAMPASPRWFVRGAGQGRGTLP